MNTLKIPDGGLLLAGSPGEDSSLPAQAFTLTLDPKIIQDMVRAAKSNENLHLDLGKSPVSSFLVPLISASGQFVAASSSCDAHERFPGAWTTCSSGMQRANTPTNRHCIMVPSHTKLLRLPILPILTSSSPSPLSLPVELTEFLTLQIYSQDARCPASIDPSMPTRLQSHPNKGIQARAQVQALTLTLKLCKMVSLPMRLQGSGTHSGNVCHSTISLC